MQRKQIPSNQNWLINAMQSLGFKSAVTGVCFGVSCMAMQAILGEDIATFESRLFLIFNLANQVSLDKETLLDIYAFFSGVELYHQPDQYESLFATSAGLYQAASTSSALVTSITLEQAGGIDEAAPFSGAYSLDELNHYFSSLRETLIAQKSSHPVALILRSSNHAITVSFDAAKKEWVLLDINQAPFKRFKQDKDIAKAVHHALTKSKTAIFSTSVFACHQHQIATKNMISHWHAHRDFEHAHVITAEKTKLTDSNDANLLYLATYQGDAKTVETLLTHGANPNEGRQSDGISPLYLAAYKGNAAITALLLKHGANPNNISTLQTSPLITATIGKFNDVATLLLTNGANVNMQRITDGGTALYVAACNNNTDALSLLLAHGANPNIVRTTDQLSPLAVAAWKGHTQAVKYLLDAHANTNLRLSPTGETPLILAAKSGHTEIVKLLLHANASTKETTKNKECAAQLAAKAGHHDIAALIKHKQSLSSRFFGAIKNKVQAKPAAPGIPTYA